MFSGIIDLFLYLLRPINRYSAGEHLFGLFLSIPLMILFGLTSLSGQPLLCCNPAKPIFPPENTEYQLHSHYSKRFGKAITLNFMHQGTAYIYIIYVTGKKEESLYELGYENPVFTATNTNVHFLPVAASYGFVRRDKRLSWGIQEIEGVILSGRFVHSKSGSEYTFQATPEWAESRVRGAWWSAVITLGCLLLATVCFIKSAAGFWRQNRYENEKLARQYRALREKQADEP